MENHAEIPPCARASLIYPSDSSSHALPIKALMAQRLAPKYSEPIAYACASKRTGHPSIGVPMGYPPCYVAHAIVLRRLACFLGHDCKHMAAQSLLQTRVLCCASLQAKGMSSKKLAKTSAFR